MKRLIVLLGVAVAVVLLAGIQWQRMAADPDFVWLGDEGEATWIVEDRPFRLASQPYELNALWFRHRFQVDDSVSARFVIYALRRADIYIDGERIEFEPDPDHHWKRPFVLDLDLPTGRHELVVQVANHAGPPALLAYSPDLDIGTDHRWQTGQDGAVWRPARAADQRDPPKVSRTLPSTTSALATYAPAIGLLWLAATILALVRPQWIRASHVRWLLLIAWATLGVHNFGRIPLGLGTDVIHHIAYIQFILDKGAIPLASDGVQAFQSPLYYLICAALAALLEPAFGEPGIFHVLGLVSVLCGLAQVELCYRASRHVFADERLRALATLLGGLLPASLYASQYIGNEPLAGALTAAVLVLALGAIKQVDGWPPRQQYLMGAIYGLALLAKVSPVILIPALVGAIVAAQLLAKVPPATMSASLARVLGACALVCGWYYLRNWWHLGAPFLGGWNPERGITWWQDPGYRVAADAWSFGQALVYPVYASRFGFFDGLYSTLWFDGHLSGITDPLALPWNLSFALVVPLLAIVPTAMLLVGVFLAPSAPLEKRFMLLFLAASLMLYLAAMFYLWLQIPIYSSVKATYLLGVTPAIAILAVYPLARLPKPMQGTAVAAYTGVVAGLGTFSYLGYLAAQH